MVSHFLLNDARKTLEPTDPRYENWVIPPQKLHRFESERTVQIPPGLQLSTRRGPEVELYDVAGVHLLTSAFEPSNAFVSTLNVSHHFKRNQLFGSCWTTPKQSKRFPQVAQICETPVVFVNKGVYPPSTVPSSEFSLGRLPTKTSQSNGFARQPVPMERLAFHRRTDCSRQSHSGCALCLSCISSNPGCHNPRDELINHFSCEQRKHYRHRFTLAYRRLETMVFLILLLILCAMQLSVSLAYVVNHSSQKQHELNTKLPHVSMAELGQLCVICMALFISICGVSCLIWDCTMPRKQTTDPSDSPMAEPQTDVERHVTNLLAAERFRRRLQCVQVLSYLSCLLLSVAMLPWLSLCQLFSANSHILTYNCVGAKGGFPHANSTGTTSYPVSISGPLRLPSWHILPHEVSEPTDSLWSVLWIVIAVHGLFDLDNCLAKPWRYAYTVTVCLVQLILSNAFYAFDSSGFAFTLDIHASKQTNGSLLCPAWLSGSQLFTPVPWWDTPVGLICRANVATLLAFIVAHIVGQTVARWTTQHRHRLFFTAGLTQAKIHRLEYTELKLADLARSLVPTPLAKELADDFIAGYLGWSSPLVIYLRNVSFLSAELVGLSSLASVVACSPTPLVATQQFALVVNELFGCFDRIARAEGCYRVRLNSVEYLCIAGYPETRVDHARCCVDFGLTMLRIVNELAKMANVQLELKVAVHTGTTYAAVLGRSRLGFDLTGDDVSYTSHLRQAASRFGRVLVSRATFNQLPEGFRGEAGPVLGFPVPHNIGGQTKPTTMGLVEPSSTSPNTTMETYFIQPRKSHLNSANSEGPTINNPSSLDTTVHFDWPKLSELSVDSLGLLTRLATAATIVCRRAWDAKCPVQSSARMEVPFDTLLVDPSALIPAKETADKDMDESREVRLGLLQALSNSEYSDVVPKATREMKSRPMDASSMRDPSISELLAMAAVTLAQSYEHDPETVDCSEKLVPCQRRAGKLRGKCPALDGTAAPEPGDGGSTMGADNSMGTSLATMTTGAMNPSSSVPSSKAATHPDRTKPWQPLVHHLPWLCTSPPGHANPHWLTLSTTKDFTPSFRCFEGLCSQEKPYASLPHAQQTKIKEDTDEDNQSTGVNCWGGCHRSSTQAGENEDDSYEMTSSLSPNQWIRILCYALISMVLLVVILGLISLLTISISFLYTVAYVILFVCLVLQLIALNLIKRFPRLQAVVHSIPYRTLLIGSIFVVAIATVFILSTCHPALLVSNDYDGSGITSIPNNSSNVFLSSSRGDSRWISRSHLCPLTMQFTLLSCFVCLLPAVVALTTMYWSNSDSSVSSRSDGMHAVAGAIVLPQPIRLVVGMVLYLLQLAVFLWATFHVGMFHRLFPVHHRNTLELTLVVNTFVQNMFALFAFTLLALSLPRTLEFQSHLLRQWIIKGEQTVRHLSSTQLALARLLTSTVPRFVIATLCNPSKTPELYAKSQCVIGLTLIQLTVVADRQPSSLSTANSRVASGQSSVMDEPAQIADRLRLLNHLIGLIDSLAKEGLDVPKRVDDSDRADQACADDESTQCDGGPSLIKVHVGGTCVGYGVGLSPTYPIHDSQSRCEHLTHLLTFTERVLDVCEEFNAKARATNTVVYARIALHSGPGLIALIGKQRPVLNLWGDPVNVCLHLLHESHVPILVRQHLLLATDDVISAIPPSRLEASALSGTHQSLIWRCVDIQSGRILLSAQLLTALASPAAPGGPNTGRRPSAHSPLHFCSVQVTVPDPDEDYANKATFALVNLAKRASVRSGEANMLRRKQQVSVTIPEPVRQSQHIRQSVNIPQAPAVSTTVELSITRSVQTASVNSQSGIISNWTGGPVATQSIPQRYSRANNLPSVVSVQQPLSLPPPPPPPPHQRIYPSSEQTATQENCLPVTPLWTAPVAPKPVAFNVNTSFQSSHPSGPSGPSISHSITEGLCDAVSNQTRLRRLSPERKYSEPPSTMNRQAVRRDVLSQCVTQTHDYSVVNVEPPSPHTGQSVSHIVARHRTQSTVPSIVPPPPCANRSGDYWPNTSMAQLLTEGILQQHRRSSQGLAEHADVYVSSPLAKKHLEPTVHCTLSPSQPTAALRPMSLSSTDSFLTAEKACAVECENTDKAHAVDVLAKNGIGSHATFGDKEDKNLSSHLNPLYTDNEYESMTESQSNLIDAVQKVSRRCRLARNRNACSPADSARKLTDTHSLFLARVDLDSRDRFAIQQPTGYLRIGDKPESQGHPFHPQHNSNGPSCYSVTSHSAVPCYAESSRQTVVAPVSCKISFGDRSLDFPDIRRPSSPGYPHTECGMHTNHKSSLPSVPLHYVGGIDSGLAGKDAHSNKSSAARSAPGLKLIETSLPYEARGSSTFVNPTQLEQPRNGVGSFGLTDSIRRVDSTQFSGMLMKSQKSAVPREYPTTSYDLSDAEAEYAGTCSLGPISMAVQPSLAGDDGITSCDGDYDDYDDEDREQEFGAVEKIALTLKDTKQLIPSEVVKSNCPRNVYYSPDQPDTGPTMSKSSFSLRPPADALLMPANLCMTDSLIANPDLDARESEIGDDLEPAVAPGYATIPDCAMDRDPLFVLLNTNKFTSSGMTNGAGIPFSPSASATAADADEVFAYHHRPHMFVGSRFVGSTAATSYLPSQPTNCIVSSFSGNQVFTEQSVPPSHNFLPNAGHYISEHASHLQRPQPTRPSLPDVAPVGLPDFGRPAPLADSCACSSTVPSLASSLRAHDNTVYDNLYTPVINIVDPPSGVSRNVSGTDPVSGSSACSVTRSYVGDAASSVYDTGDDEEEEESNMELTHAASESFEGTPVGRPLIHSACLNGLTVPSTLPYSPFGTTMLALSVNSPVGTRTDTKPTREVPLTLTAHPEDTHSVSPPHRASSSAGSQTSGPSDQQRSEYDNVTRSSSASLNTAFPRRTVKAGNNLAEANAWPIPPSPGRAGRNRVSNRNGYVGGQAEHPRASGLRGLFDAEIVAEARRISRQFRAMGWIPAMDYPQHCLVDVDPSREPGLNSRLPPGPEFPASSSGLPRAPLGRSHHLFLLPVGSQMSTPCSRQTSFQHRPRRNGSAVDSETVTTVTSQFDDEDYQDDADLENHTDASGLEDENIRLGHPIMCMGGPASSVHHGAWMFNSPEQQLGCLLVRPRSLSTTCLDRVGSEEQHELLTDLLTRSLASSSEVSSEEILVEESSEPNKTSSNGIFHSTTMICVNVQYYRSVVMLNMFTVYAAKPTKNPVLLKNNCELPYAHLRNETESSLTAQPHTAVAPCARLCDRQRHSLRRSKSSRTVPLDQVKRPNGSPGFTRLQRRAARVRSLIPPELQPYILPSCMSSLSRSSSMASSGQVSHPDMVFVSLTRQHSTRHRRSRSDRAHSRPFKSASDPELFIELLSGRVVTKCHLSHDK
ncbi:uncharacterized protein DEA37_0010216 [Paragonimus westermani]|uniref:adenylate cyclase n=1 Tax=Paragonimus westermani TaxID=34504 RepID=A0A5J4NWP6_9TREM|nr:uncharacterized protein DEA37_0010216 [Paragonimus westermani]